MRIASRKRSVHSESRLSLILPLRGKWTMLNRAPTQKPATMMYTLPTPTQAIAYPAAEASAQERRLVLDHPWGIEGRLSTPGWRRRRASSARPGPST